MFESFVARFDEEVFVCLLAATHPSRNQSAKSLASYDPQADKSGDNRNEF